MVRKNTPPLFSSQLFIAVIDIFYMVSKNILDNSDKKYLSPRKINFFGFYFSFAVNRKQEILLAITGFENELVMNNGLIRSTGYDRLVYTISLSGLHEQISIGLNDAENSIVGIGGY